MYAIVYGDIGDIDYIGAVGPFPTLDEANKEGERLQTEKKLPDEAQLEEVAWRVVPLTAPSDLEPSYFDEGDF